MAGKVGYRIPRWRVVGQARRYARGFLNVMGPARNSYASDGEDVAVNHLLDPFDLDGAIYVDVGANDPVSISNTYLFYRNGLQGVCIDPNPEMAPLFDLFRPRDICVIAGCSDEYGFSRLAGPSTTTASLIREKDSSFGRLVPVAQLDDILKPLDVERIFLLSIDTEGNELAVLRGARETLIRTQFVLAETTNPESDADITSAMSARGFDLLKRVGLNLLYRNRSNILAPKRQFSSNCPLIILSNAK